MPDSLISSHTAYVASLRGCPSCPDRLSALAGMRNVLPCNKTKSDLEHCLTAVLPFEHTGANARSFIEE
jgi:hypothetical protein